MSQRESAGKSQDPLVAICQQNFGEQGQIRPP